ncbi:MAG: hypothetical protein ABFC34_05395 [Methanobacterium sp.]
MQTHEGLVIINHGSVVLLISEYWPDEYLICGKENVKNIVEDVLAGNASKEKFEAPPVGDRFDITFDLETVLAAAQLIVAVYQVIKCQNEQKQDDHLISRTELKIIVESENETKIVVENYVNAANSKAWDILNDKQKVDLIDFFIKFK